MAESITIKALQDASLNVKSLEEVVNGNDTKQVTTRLGETYPSVKKAIKTLFENGGLPATPFKTKVLMEDSELVDGDYAVVTDDTDDNNGIYIKEVGAWSKSKYDSKSNIDDLLSRIEGVSTNFDNRYIPILADANNRILIGYDTLEDKAIIAGSIEGGSNQVDAQEFDINHFLFYGQSLSVGATAIDILSTSQPYSNLTFNTSPRMDGTATSVIPLVEQANNPSSDGKADRGETVCSGAANYASRSMMLENSINPDNHVIFASTAGHGGYRVDQLEKGTDWYNFFKSHVQKAFDLNTQNVGVTAIGWVQGENDAVYNVKTPYQTYKDKLVKLQKDMSEDIRVITGQNGIVPFITYQMSYEAQRWDAVAKAQLDLVRESDSFHMATPIYHIPYATDKVHLTSIGYKWLGAYFGRAYKQLVIDKKEPDYINPLSATIRGNTVTVKFDVPKKPLVLDVETLAVTTDNGFKVVDQSGVKINISDISVADDTVLITLASTPSSNVSVRYALDYQGAGLTVTGGASGNLRDSTTDTVIISGQSKSLYHVCPHFELTAFADKGI